MLDQDERNKFRNLLSMLKIIKKGKMSTEENREMFKGHSFKSERSTST